MLGKTKNGLQHTTNKTILTDISEINSLTIRLSKELKTLSFLTKLVPQSEHLLDLSNLRISVIFLTEKNQNVQIEKILNWVGITDDFSEEEVFSGSLKGKIQLKNNVDCTVDILHFDQYPSQKLSTLQNDIQVIVYDQNYVSQLQDYNLAIKILEKDPAICFLIDISEKEQSIIPQIINIYTKKYASTELQGSLFTSFLDIGLEQLLEIIRVSQFFNYTKKISFLLKENFELKQMQFKGKAILVNQKLLEIQNENLELSTKELNSIKSRIANDFKYITKIIDDKIGDFDKNNDDLKFLQEEISSFLGFVETKRGKNLILKISDGAINDKINKTQYLLTNFLENINKDINDNLIQLNLWLQNTYSVWDLEIPEISLTNLTKGLVQETLNSSNTHPEKVYEKQISFKNIGNLLMELRTPLFMLMPFMMIFAVFGALTNSEDQGVIDESQLFFDNRPCIAITSLPITRDNAFRKFITEVDALRDPKKGVFHREINNELVTEPQLAVKEVETIQNYNGKVKTEEALDYYFDKKKQILYLFLMEHADRSFVIDKLLDPENKLLSIPSNSRRGFGIGGFIRALSGLSEYRYVILISLGSLILWFVITRKKSMDVELKTSKEREQFKLNSELRQHIEKNIKQSFLKYNSKIITELNSLEVSVIKNTDFKITKEIEASKKEKIKKEKIVQKRFSGLKIEKSALVSWNSDFNKLEKKISQLETKLKRLKK